MGTLPAVRLHVHTGAIDGNVLSSVCSGRFPESTLWKQLLLGFKKAVLTGFGLSFRSTAMGSGTSRGKKVAPACVREVRMSKAGGAGVHPSQEARGPLSQHKVQPESHSEGPHSDDDTDGPSVRKTSPRRTFIRSKTYGLCPFSGGDTEDEASCSPRVPRSVPRDQNKRSDCVFTPRKQQTPADFTQRHVRIHTSFLSITRFSTR